MGRSKPQNDPAKQNRARIQRSISQILNGEDEEEMKQGVQVGQMDDRSTKTKDLSSELIEKSKKMLDASERHQLLKKNQKAIKLHYSHIEGICVEAQSIGWIKSFREL